MTGLPMLAERAWATAGRSAEPLYQRAAALLVECGVRGVVADVGCGEGRLRAALGDSASAYIGIDAMRFDAYPAGVPFHQADFDRDALPLPDASVDAAVALETIEHLENPRRFMRELVRVTRPGGVVIVSTPNQISALSLLSLAFRQRFAAFQDAHYPVHLTALLPIDLERIAGESGAARARLAYSLEGRVPLSRVQYPRWFARLSPRLLSDHVFLIARRPS